MHSSTLFLNLDTAGYTATAGCTATAGYTATQSDVTQNTFRLAQQDTQQHNLMLHKNLPIGTAGYTAGQQDTRLNYRIRGWTTGYTAKQDTWLDYRIHSQTGYVAGLQDTQPRRIRGRTLHGSSTLQQQGRETDLKEQNRS